ncbi:hypothetical protein CAPTEDRAFT_190630 [Capitella teleta]|uniref:G-protein coupled receptors family 1 profile domain-containing protein n=1 Tax=Capitella teleta TaxID=283909 RepID=R7U375_CAPTE|nr:hypothetical protein CAPTEDRAFT_190630 [Capitella teleta]|eukprot:ELU00795.1 hypothetical protein CAPTEDRAFT_190630 [Capitella teleta]
MGDHPEPENSSLIDDVTSGIMSQNMSNAFATKRIAIQLAKYCLPMLILSGTIGNALSFIVLLRKRMRSTSIYVYLLCLACVDMLVLYTSAFKTWIRILTDFEFLHQSGFTCKTTMFVLLVSQHMSAWLIVVVTFDSSELGVW